MNTENTIDTSHLREVRCPHCGHDYDCSYELFTEDASDEQERAVECENCDKTFTARINITVTYTTEKKDSK